MPLRRHLSLILLILLALPLGAQQLRSDIEVDSLLAFARRYLGTPYRWAGSSPKGFDCAGFTRYVYGRYGVALPHSSAAQYPVGTPVERGEWQPGDLVFFAGRALRSHIGHVGIVTDADSAGFNFIHASVGHGIRVSHSSESYYAPRYRGACRLIAPKVGADHAAVATDHAPLTLALVGDILLGNTYPCPTLPFASGRHLFDHARPLLAAADLALGNLEGPFCDTTVARRKQESDNAYAFRMPPSLAPLLREAGFDFVSLANNHSADFGHAGLRQTTHLLDSLGIAYAGLRRRCPTTVVEVQGVRVGIAAFGHNSHTPRLTDSALVASTLLSLRDSCQVVVVSFHGGAEGKAYIHVPDSAERYLGERRGDVRRFARQCVDLGADLVVGHGPHVPRAMELYRGRLIAYSLGNFCTPVGISLDGILGYAPLVTVRLASDGRLVEGCIHSFQQPYRKGPRPDAEHRAARLMAHLSRQDFGDPGLTFHPDGPFHPTKRP